MKSHTAVSLLVRSGILTCLATSCAPTRFTTDEFEKRQPITVLVLPTINSTVDMDAPVVIRPMIAHHVADRGYYVLPSAAVDAVLQSQGVTDPGMVTQIDTFRFREVFGADATLYSEVYDWSTKYLLLASTVTVGVEMRLVDNDSGAILWGIRRSLTKNSGGGGGGTLVGALVSMAVSAAAHATLQSYRPIARENITGLSSTLPPGVFGIAYKNLKAVRNAEKHDGKEDSPSRAAEKDSDSSTDSRRKDNDKS